MGNFRSGRPQKRRRVEDATRVGAVQWCRQHQGETVTRTTPDGNNYDVGKCPRCARTCRNFYRVGSGAACQKCAGLIHRSASQRNSHAEKVKAQPELIGEALQTMRAHVQTGDASSYNTAMKTLVAAQSMPLDRLPSSDNAEAIFAKELRARILADDLQSATGLLEIIKAQILEGVENTMNRRGEPLEIAMRGDTLAKLSGAYATISNLRDNRATQAAQLIADRGDQADRERERQEQADAHEQALARVDAEMANPSPKRWYDDDGDEQPAIVYKSPSAIAVADAFAD